MIYKAPKRQSLRKNRGA